MPSDMLCLYKVKKFISFAIHIFKITIICRCVGPFLERLNGCTIEFNFTAKHLPTNNSRFYNILVFNTFSVLPSLTNAIFEFKSILNLKVFFLRGCDKIELLLSFHLVSKFKHRKLEQAPWVP